MTKTLDDYWRDWEGYAFGYGYGSGEPPIIAALKKFFDLCPKDPRSGVYRYDYLILEEELTPAVAWLLINRLCQVDIISYGTSSRFGFLTTHGNALKEYVDRKSTEELCEILDYDEDYIRCYPDVCNCGEGGYREGKICSSNPFWKA